MRGINWKLGAKRLAWLFVAMLIGLGLMSWNLGSWWNPFTTQVGFVFELWEVFVSCVCYVIVLWGRERTRESKTVAFVFAGFLPFVMNTLSPGMMLTENRSLWIPAFLCPFATSAILYVCFVLEQPRDL